MSERLQQLITYLRAEADFNRSWTDGRRGVPFANDETYKQRRIELSVEREQWAAEVEKMLAVYEAATQYVDSEFDNSRLCDLEAAIDAARGGK